MRIKVRELDQSIDIYNRSCLCGKKVTHLVEDFSDRGFGSRRICHICARGYRGLRQCS